MHNAPVILENPKGKLSVKLDGNEFDFFTEVIQVFPD